jgi:cytochrome c oxidase subunit 2
MNRNVRSRSRGRAEALFVALMFFGLSAGMLYLGMRGWLPAVASQHGPEIDRMLLFLLVTTGLLALIGHVVLGVFIWRFTHGGKITQRMASSKTEKVWSIIPALLMTLVAEGGVLVIGMPVWNEYYASDAPASAVTIEVTAEQFSWNVRYPGEDGAFGRTDPKLMDDINRIGLDPSDPEGKDDIVRINRIVIPVDRPARIRLRAKDVIHSFFLPHFRIKQDAVPGMTIDVWFVPTEEGDYELACTELCGLAHYYMKGTVDVVSAEEYTRWLEESAAELAEQG